MVSQIELGIGHRVGHRVVGKKRIGHRVKAKTEL